MKANEFIGANIKKWREFKQIKQDTLAKNMNITSATLSRIETGKTDITVSRIQEIADQLDIDFTLLFSSPQQIINNHGLLNTVNGNGGNFIFSHDSKEFKEFVKSFRSE